MTRLMGWMCLFLLVALVGPLKAAADYYVDLDWTGATNGTETEPYTTLSAAVVPFVANGGSVLVAGGVYKSVSEGGYENFGMNGYDIGVSNKAGVWQGGYAGWDGVSSFDWTEASRTYPTSTNGDEVSMTVVDLTNANSRAFCFSQYGVNIDFEGFLFRNSSVTQSAYKGGALFMNGGMQWRL